MTGRTAVATAHWRRLDMQGTDRCTLSKLEQGWILVGQAIWHDAGSDNALTYDIRCDTEWRSLSANVGGEVGGRDIALRLNRADDGWHLNDRVQPGTAACIDLDLSFTPATNLIPLRRVRLNTGGTAEIHAAWLTPDLATLKRLDQTYSSPTPDRVHYRSSNCAVMLEVHPSDFVTHYPDLWEGWVDA